MPAIRVTCRACGATFKVDAKHAGRKGRCPKANCSGVYIVPDLPDDEDEFAPIPSAVKSRLQKSSAQSSSKRKKTSKAAKSSSRWWLIAGGSVCLLAVVAVGMAWLFSGAAGGTSLTSAAVAAQAPPTPPPFETQALPFLKQHCLDCHSGDEPEAGISFANFTNEQQLLKQRKLWQRVLDLIDQGVMPPADAAQPTASEKETVVQYLNHALYYVDCSQAVDPGRVTIRRLNRAEYNNTIRDLVGVTFRPADDFPSDDVGYGFDNIGDVLSLPPLLMEKYLEAAEAVAKEAVVVVDPNKPKVVTTGSDALIRGPAAHDANDAVILVSTGHVSTKFNAPLAGEYIIRVRAGGQRAGNDLPKLEIRVPKQSPKSFNVEAKNYDMKDHEHRVTLPAGQTEIIAAFTNDYYDEKKKEDRNLLVRQIEVVGPMNVKPEDFPPFQREFLASRPSADMSVNVAVRNDLRPFLKRAFRRPIQESELDLYVQFVQKTVEQGESFEAAMQQTLTAILVSPHFLFRVETDRNPNDPHDLHPLNDFELAARLSYFLWSSMPDDKLLALAERNELHRDDVIVAEVQRMLADSKSQALVDNFAEQWLQLRILNDIRPDPELYPAFSPELRADMQQETKQLFTHIMRNDRSLLDLLEARYTFLNERLAKHYGINGVQGNEFREVSLEGTPRTGLLTHASVMTMTSNPNRTSPVKRGKWIMEVVLNTPPPPPPPNVPELEAAKADESMTFRQQLELHRQNATCASCHRTMDELGFGLENFDPIGRFREKDGERPLDVTGLLPDGNRFAGPQELAQTLKKRQTQFAQSVSEKLLTYALGRGTEYYDRCTVNKIADQLELGQFRFSALVNAIVKSEPFRMRRGEDVTTN
ncbi:DUF1592 domain-containing protein [bacterium]|nr:DUF1592 domain-containing protein [bacterium]